MRLDSVWKDIDPNTQMLAIAVRNQTRYRHDAIVFIPSGTLNDKGYSIQIQQSIASIYYLNGKLLAQFGHIDHDPKK